MLDWIIENKEWVFSGVGVAAVGIVLAHLGRRGRAAQTQTGGDHSTNIQAGGSIDLFASKKEEDGK